MSVVQTADRRERGNSVRVSDKTNRLSWKLNEEGRERYTSKEKAVWSAIPKKEGKRITTSDLIVKVYDDREPEHARESVMLHAKHLIEKIKKNREPFVLCRSSRLGPYPSEFWIERRK